MRHHFGDSLDREGGYWTIVPNRERYAYRIGDVPAGSSEITIVTIGKEDKHWDRVLTLPNLEELTLHEPTQEQLAALTGLRRLKRLRVTHARPKNIEPLAALHMLEELVMEYVSGFSDLSPLQRLANLRAVHLENLRRVSCFEGLPGNLRYLSIQGTLDWNQPIRDFEFLRSLPKLEILHLWTFITKSPYPALLPALHLTNLKKLHMASSYVAAEECALLEEALPGVAGASWGPYRKWTLQTLELARDDVRAHLPVEVIRAHHPEVSIRYDGTRTIPDPEAERFEFTGKGAGSVKCLSPRAAEKCRAYAASYEAMKDRARETIRASRVVGGGIE